LSNAVLAPQAGPASGVAPAVPVGLTYRDQVDLALAAVPVGTPAPAVWAALGAAGAVDGVYVDGDPRRGVDPDRLGLLLATLDARAEGGVTLSACVQVATALPILAAGAAGPHRTAPATRALRSVRPGSATVALAATDADRAGSDLTGLGTTVDIGPDGLVVNGRKEWITNAVGARHLLVLARHRPGPHFTNFTWVLVPTSAPGVTVRPADTTLFAGAGVGHVDLSGVRLPADHLVGGIGRGMPLFARHIVTERLAGALWATALARRAIVDTRNLVAGRLTATGPVGDLDPVRQTLADCVVRLAGLRALCREQAPVIAQRHDPVAAALVKAAAADCTEYVLGACAHLQGARGFAAGGAQTLRAEAALFGIGGGATELMWSTIADHAEDILAEMLP
jgi:alkylation response protein AidB-like acyl-CoA dehydrogenase